MTAVVPPLEWWLLHVAQTVLLVLAVTFAFIAARRAGGHTLYGNLLLLLALGFWCLLLGEALFAGRQALGGWDGPGSFNDAWNLLGWSLLLLSVFLFVERFSPVDGRTSRRRGLFELLAFMGVPVAAVVFVFFTWLDPAGADPHARLRLAYLVLDAMSVGIIAGGLDRFLRLRKGALGRLYLYLGAAILFKTAGDVHWAYLAARGGATIIATALYPIAGVLGVVGLGLHLRSMRRERLDRSIQAPWLHPQQQRLANLAARMEEAAGGYAARTVLLEAGAVLARQGTPWRIEGGTVESEASSEAWDEAFQAARRVAVALLGASAARALETMAQEERP